MAKDRKKVQHIHSSVPDKQPTPAALEVGEIAVNNAKDQEFLSIKNSEDKVVRFSSDEQIVTIMEKKEVMPYAGYVRGETGPSATSAETPTADARGSYGITNNDLLNNKSNIVVKLNQVAAGNTAKHDRVNGAKDAYDKLVNPTTDGGVTDGAGFFIDMSRYAMQDANPSFSSTTNTCRTTMSGTTIIRGLDGACGSLFDIKVNSAKTDIETATTEVTVANTTIGTNSTTISGNTTLNVSGTTTETKNGDVAETNLGNKQEATSGNSYNDVKLNYSGTTGGTTTETKVGNVTENNLSAKTENTTGVLTENNSSNHIVNTTGNTNITRTGVVTEDNKNNVVKTTSGTTTETFKDQVTENNQSGYTINTTGNVITNTTGTTTETKVGNVTENHSGTTTETNNGAVTITNNNDKTETTKGNVVENVSGTTTENLSGKLTVNVTGGTEFTSCSAFTVNTNDYKIKQCAGTSGNAEFDFCGGYKINTDNMVISACTTGGTMTVKENAVNVSGGTLTIRESGATDFSGASLTETVTGNSTTTIGGDSTTTVSGNVTEAVTGNSTTTVGGNTTITTSGNTVIHSDGAVGITAKQDITAVSSEKDVIITANKNLCATAGDNATIYGEDVTNLGTKCDGTGASTTTNMSGVTINISGTTFNENIGGNSTVNIGGNETVNVGGATTINSTGNTCINSSAVAAMVGSTKTNVGKNCSDGGQTTTLNLNGTTINETGTTVNISGSSNVNVSADTICLSGKTAASMYAPTTNVGTSCGGSSATTINISGTTINEGGTTLNQKITNVSADTTNYTINTTNYDLNGAEICISGSTKANVYGATTNVGVDCDGTTTATTINVSGATINGGGTTNNNNFSTINTTATTVNESITSKNITANTENHTTTGYNVSTTTACLVASNKATLGGDNATNIGTSCEGTGISDTTTIYGYTINNSANTVNTTAVTENNNATTINTTATTVNQSGNSVNVTADTNYTVTTSALCLTASDKVNIGGDNTTNIGTNCAGSQISDNINLYSSSSVTINSPKTIITGDTYIEGKAVITGPVEIKVNCTGLTSHTVSESFCETLSRSNVTITASTDPEAGILKRYDFYQNGNKFGTVDIPKDYLVKSGSVIVSGGTKYIDLVLNTRPTVTGTPDEHIYINVADLVTDTVYKSNGGTLSVTTGHNTSDGTDWVNYDVANSITWSLGIPSADSTGYNGSSTKNIVIPSDANHIANRSVSWSYGDVTNASDGSYAPSQASNGSFVIPKSLKDLNNNLSDLTFTTGTTSVAGSPYNGSSAKTITIPSDASHIGIRTLTIKKNNSSVGTYNPASTSNTEINITVPTSTDDITNNLKNLTFTTGTTSVAGSPYNGSSAKTITIPSCVSHLDRRTLSWTNGAANTGSYDPGSACSGSDNISIPSSLSHLTDWSSNCLNVTNNICVTGTITATGGMYTSSDEALKDDIHYIKGDEISRARKVNLKSFYYKSDASRRKTYGVIAQDVEKVGLEELVHYDENGMRAVDYIGLLLLKMAGLEKEIDILKHKLEEKNN